ncbi:MAG: hypothetical protein J6W54_04175 [Fibrobacter sp.]|uniref:hypothetical protein n=1 Tax=Fibrobacter sp. TaxID=35828 RepID=UPI001B014D5F|nr:hypothetical protein [Fibrobacter sp.]MBO7060278.1 hypothetical protein [Fibrobacter sp.]
MTESLTNFFMSDGWRFVSLAVFLIGLPLIPFLYYDLDGIMSKRTFFKLCLVEAVICSTMGFGDILKTIGFGLVTLWGIFLFSLFIEDVVKNWK